MLRSFMLTSCSSHGNSSLTPSICSLACQRKVLRISQHRLVHPATARMPLQQLQVRCYLPHSARATPQGPSRQAPLPRPTAPHGATCTSIQHYHLHLRCPHPRCAPLLYP